MLRAGREKAPSPLRFREMQTLENKRVLVIGLGTSGLAACDLLQRRAAEIVAVDSAETPALCESVALLRTRGIQAELHPDNLPAGPFDFAIISPGVPTSHPWARELRECGIP